MRHVSRRWGTMSRENSSVGERDGKREAIAWNRDWVELRGRRTRLRGVVKFAHSSSGPPRVQWKLRRRTKFFALRFKSDKKRGTFSIVPVAGSTSEMRHALRNPALFTLAFARLPVGSRRGKKTGWSRLEEKGNRARDWRKYGQRAGESREATIRRWIYTHTHTHIYMYMYISTVGAGDGYADALSKVLAIRCNFPAELANQKDWQSDESGETPARNSPSRRNCSEIVFRS